MSVGRGLGKRGNKKSPGWLRLGIGTDCYPLRKRVKYGIAFFEGRTFSQTSNTLNRVGQNSQEEAAGGMRASQELGY